MKFEKLVAGIFMLSSVGALASPMHRFWRGEKRADLSDAQFLKSLNEGLLPQTIEVGTEGSLSAYQPVILPRDVVKNLGAPAEVALVSYSDEDAYRALRATPRGMAYADLHWESFVKESSGSAVPEAFRGLAETNRAYNLFGEEVDWQAGVTVFRVRGEPRGGAMNLAALGQEMLLRQRDRAPGLRAAVVLVSQRYTLEYESWDPAAVKEDFPLSPSASASTYFSIALPSLEAGEAIGFGEGANFRFALRP